MARLRALDRMAGLLRVQKAKRAAAASDLGDANRRMLASDAARQEALDGCGEAEERWLQLLSGRRFSPDHVDWSRSELIARAREAESATARADRDAELRQQKEREWCEAEARARLGEEGLRKMRRKESRRSEEKRLGALADLISYRWSRR